MAMPRMLIVEDEVDINDCLQQYFSSKGFSVAAAYSGEEAVEKLQAERPEVVLLDVMLPGLSGIEVLKKIRELDPTMSVIMVTALNHDEVRAQAERFGATAYITKPFDFSDETWSPAFNCRPKENS